MINQPAVYSALANPASWKKWESGGSHSLIRYDDPGGVQRILLDGVTGRLGPAYPGGTVCPVKRRGGVLGLLGAALSVAVLHTLLPAHWLPYVTVARSNGWPAARLMGLTLAGTLIHLVSTALLTAIALVLSYGASHTLGHTLERAGAGLLLILAVLYFFLPARIERWSERLTWLLAIGVGIQPCIELVPLMLVAAASGPTATVVVGATWAFVTIALSLALALCGYWGITLGWTRRLATYAYPITGLVLFLSGAGLFMHAH